MGRVFIPKFRLCVGLRRIVMYVVIGGRGYLGSYLIKNIIENCSEKIIATYHSEEYLKNSEHLIWQRFDASDEKSIFALAETIKKNKIEGDEVKCIYTIGYIRPDNCVKFPELAIDINIRALVNFINYTKNLFDGLIFTSTDFVMGESLDDYRFKETDTPKPINLFGTIKYTCETICLANNYNVVRCPFMVGESLIPEKPYFIEHIKRTIAEHKYFDVLSDYYETSLDYNTVANCIYILFSKYGSKIPEKVIHVVGDEKISKYEIAVRYAKKFNLDSHYLRPISLAQADFFIAKRCTILLDNTLLKSLIGKNRILLEL